jgi:transcriptional regulator with XRE-family HTH domain/tetratricopeptide (TPR) repeat protein
VAYGSSCFSLDPAFRKRRPYRDGHGLAFTTSAVPDGPAAVTLAEVPRPPLQSLGEFLFELRGLTGKTQEELAQDSGLSVRSISDLERDRVSRPRRRSLELLAAALNLDPVHGKALIAIARRAPGTRRALAEELGVEQATELNDLYQQILAARADFAPRPTAANGTVPTAVVPRQLPTATRHFGGRTGDLAALGEVLDEAGRKTQGTLVISAVGGTAGVGKTALALHWAHQEAHRFGDGQLYVNLRGFDSAGAPVTADEAIRGFLDALGVPGHRIPADLAASAALYRSLLAGRRVLVVLDNARDEQQVRPLLPGGPGCLVIVTSRSQLAGLAAAEGARLITLDVLTDAEARQMLSVRLGDRAAAEPDAVDEIAQLCARLPLALAIAAAHAAARPRVTLADLAVLLGDQRVRLDALDSGDPVMNVRAVFSWSVGWLSPEAAQMFRLLGLHSGPDFTASAAASLAATAPPTAARALRELAAANLLTERVPSRYSFHDLLRVYASELAGAIDGEARHAAVGRILDHYLHTARAAAMLLSPTCEQVTLAPAAPGVLTETLVDHRQALAWFEAERDALVGAITLAVDNRFLEHAWRLPLVLKTYLSWRGFWHDERAVLAAGLSAVRQLGDQAGEISIHRSLDHVYARLGDYAHAEEHIRQARGLCRRMNDVTAEAYTHVSEAWMFGAESRYDEALVSSLEALSLFQKSGHLPGEASALNSVGWYYAQTGDYESGREHCGRALDLSVEIGNTHGQANALNSLGYIEYRRGNPIGAVELLREALDKVRDLGDCSAIAESLDILGDSYLAAEDYPAAADAWREAVDVLENVDDERSRRMLVKLRSVPGLGKLGLDP